MSFPFTLVVTNSDTGEIEVLTGLEPGRARFGETKRTIPAIQSEAHRPERAVWGCDHGHHNPTVCGERVLLEHPRFAYGGCWYDSLEDWASRWGAVIQTRTVYPSLSAWVAAA